MEGLRAQGTRIGFKTDGMKTKSLTLGTSKVEEVMLGNDKIEQMDDIIYLSIINSKIVDAVKIRVWVTDISYPYSLEKMLKIE